MNETQCGDHDNFSTFSERRGVSMSPVTHLSRKEFFQLVKEQLHSMGLQIVKWDVFLLRVQRADRSVFDLDVKAVWDQYKYEPRPEMVRDFLQLELAFLQKEGEAVMIRPVTCIGCGKEFFTWKDTLYCSEQCRLFQQE
jgi:predicted Zn-ribbon and HTH transcriptional regulator